MHLMLASMPHLQYHAYSDRRCANKRRKPAHQSEGTSVPHRPYPHFLGPSVPSQKARYVTGRPPSSELGTLREISDEAAPDRRTRPSRATLSQP